MKRKQIDAKTLSCTLRRLEKSQQVNGSIVIHNVIHNERFNLCLKRLSVVIHLRLADVIGVRDVTREPPSGSLCID